MTDAIYNAQTNMIAGLRLFFLAEVARLQNECPSVGEVCNKSAALLLELAGLPATKEAEYDEFFRFRDAALKGIAESYAALSNCLTQDRLQSLQFNGVEIDTELVRLFFYGQNLVAMPNP